MQYTFSVLTEFVGDNPKDALTEDLSIKTTITGSLHTPVV